MGTHTFESEVSYTGPDVTLARHPVGDVRTYIVDRP